MVTLKLILLLRSVELLLLLVFLEILLVLLKLRLRQAFTEDGTLTINARDEVLAGPGLTLLECAGSNDLLFDIVIGNDLVMLLDELLQR